MPAPTLPGDLTLVSAATVDCAVGKCFRWRRGDEWSAVTVLQDAATGYAVEITDEQFDGESALIPALTFALENVTIFPEGASAPPLDAPNAFSLPLPHTAAKCDRNVGGSPWIELFQHYVRV
jgi:hypothetical protein